MTTRIILERYELIAELGSRLTQSEIWIGRELTHSTLVKIVRVPTRFARDKEILRAYHTPARRLKSVQRPGLEQIYDANVDGDSYYIVSEFVRGEQLSLLMDRAEQLPISLALKIMIELGQSLHVLHSISTNKGPAPIYHQMLAPHCVMLTYHGEVKLTHAAISHGESMTLDKVPLSILSYSSPEECMGGRQADASSNVFTLGVILWELLTGSALYGMHDEFDIMQAICNTPPQPPSKFNPQVPPFLDALVTKALSKDPARRLAGVGQFTAALRNVQKTLPESSNQEVADFLFAHFEDRIPSWQVLFEAEAAGDLQQLAQAISSLFIGHVAPGSIDTNALRQTEEIIYAEDSLPIFDPPSRKPAPKVLTGTSLGVVGKADQRQSSDAPVSGDFEELRGTMIGSPKQAVSALHERSQPQLTEPSPPQLQEQATSPFVQTPASMSDAFSFDQLSSELEQSAPEHVKAMGKSPRPASVEEDVFETQRIADLQEESASPFTPQQRVDPHDSPTVEREPLQLSARNDRTEEFPASLMQTRSTRDNVVSQKLQQDALPFEVSSPAAEASPETSPVAQPPRVEVAASAASSDGGAPQPVMPASSSANASHASWFFGEDDPDQEPDYFLPFEAEDLFGRPPSRQGVQAGRELLSEEPVAEVLRLVQGTVVEVATLKKGQSQYKPPRACVIAKLQGKKLVVTRSEGTTGELQLKNAEQPQALGVEGGALELNVGDAIHVHDGLFDYHIKFFYPPLPPAKLPMEKPGRLLVGFAVAGGVALALHVSAALFLVFFVGFSGTQMTVPEPDATAEVFAEGKLEDLEKPKPKPKPKPRPKPKPKPKPVQLTENRVDPTEQKAIVPKSVQKKIARRMNANKSSSSDSKADRLLGALASPNQGEGTTLQDVVSNIDAVQSSSGANSGAFRVAGTIAAIEGDSPNLATGGGGKIGDLSGGVKDGVGKVDKRKVSNGGKVRGKVRSVKALSKVKGGSLSKGDVYKEINRHMGKIRMCYERELMNDPKLAGKITFDWTVKTNGSVSGVREKSSSLGSSKVSSCIRGVIQKMKFPKPKGGEVQISYPFIFSAG